MVTPATAGQAMNFSPPVILSMVLRSPWKSSPTRSSSAVEVAATAAWITDIGEEGDYGRACVLDHPMLRRIHDRRFRDRPGRGLRRGALLPNVASRRDFDRGDRS